MTERPGEENRSDLRESRGLPGQPGEDLQRFTGVGDQSGRPERNPRSTSADTLMASNLPEEGAVDQRADPSAWYGNGSASRPADPEAHGSRYQGAGGMPAPEEDDGRSQYRGAAPPYPAQLPPPAPTSGMAAKVTAQLASLTKTKPRPGGSQGTSMLTQAARSPRVSVASRPAARTAGRTAATGRRAQLVLARIEPWSVMKFSFLVSLVGWVVMFVAVAALYYVLSKLGVFHSIQSTISNVTSSKGSAGADSGAQWFSFSRIIGYTMLIGAINVVLITALATVGAVIYNLVTSLAGGIEVTLRESD